METPKAIAVAALEPEEPEEITPATVVAELPKLDATPVVLPESKAPAAPVPVEAPSATPPSQPASRQSAEDLQRAAVEALSAAKSQGSAADAIADAEWTIEGGELRVQTGLSKTMLSMVINPEADKIIRMALRTAGAGTFKLSLLSGTTAAAAKKPKAARTGSAQAKAMDHPVVQQAQRLFNAEIRNVIDLRDND
jgi:DNA polymerase-3 subunit gamma/tau